MNSPVVTAPCIEGAAIIEAIKRAGVEFVVSVQRGRPRKLQGGNRQVMREMDRARLAGNSGPGNGGIWRNGA